VQRSRLLIRIGLCEARAEGSLAVLLLSVIVVAAAIAYYG
jgi:hypothetical protein